MDGTSTYVPALQLSPKDSSVTKMLFTRNVLISPIYVVCGGLLCNTKYKIALKQCDQHMCSDEHNLCHENAGGDLIGYARTHDLDYINHVTS